MSTTLQERDAHIIVGDFSADLAVKILCEAFKKGMHGSQYVWILPGYHQPNWWLENDETNCTLAEIESVLQGHFAVEFAPQRFDPNDWLTSNKVKFLFKRDTRSHVVPLPSLDGAPGGEGTH